jgi:hypothetical protein
VDRISVELVTERENLAVFVEDVADVRLKHVGDADVEVLKAVDEVLVLVERLVQGTVLHVHVLEAGLVLLGKKLVEKRLLQVDPLEAEHGAEAFVVAAIAHEVVAIAALVVDVHLLVEDILGRAHLGHEVDGNVLVAKITAKN